MDMQVADDVSAYQIVLGGSKRASDCLTDQYDFIYSATAPFLFKRVLSLGNYIGASAQQDMI